MKLLVIDSVFAAGKALATDLRRSIGIESLIARSTEDALDCLKVEKDAIGIIAFFLEGSPQEGLYFIHEIREFAYFASFRSPGFVVLTPANLSEGYLSRFRAEGADCLVYGFPEQLRVTVRRLRFEATCERGDPTIVVDRSAGRTDFFLLGPAGRELLSFGPRLLPMMNFFAINFRTELSREQLAEACDIAVSSVKVYVERLRARFDQARVRVGINIPGKRVFRTTRKDGGFVSILNARVLFT